MNHFDKRALILGVLFLTFLFLVAIFFPSISPVFLISHAQGSQDSKFWVFDGHMHPIGGSGNMGDADYSSKFTLPMAIEGGLGAGLFNAGIDEFYEANHLAVKSILGSFDRFYRQIELYPDQVGVARNAAEVGALRRQGKIAAILSIEGGIAIESDLGVLRMFHRLGAGFHHIPDGLFGRVGEINQNSQSIHLGHQLSSVGRQPRPFAVVFGGVHDITDIVFQVVDQVHLAQSQPVQHAQNSQVALNGKGSFNGHDGCYFALLAKGSNIGGIPGHSNLIREHGNLAIEVIKLPQRLFDGQMVGFEKLVNRGVKKGGPQLLYVTNGKIGRAPCFVD